MVGRCSRLRRNFSVILFLLFSSGLHAGSLWAEQPTSNSEAETPETATAQEATADAVAEPSSEAEELGEPVPPFVKAVEVEGEGWRPIAPMPVKFDWIQLKSDEWLKGEFIALYDENLEFDSDELDLLELDWADVKQVRTAQIMDVGFAGDIKETGRLWIEGDTIRIINDEGVGEFKRSKVISITTGAQSEFKKWSGKVSVGMTIQQGNTNQVDVNNRMNFKRRTIENRIIIDYIVNFSRVSNIDTVDNQRLNGNWDKFLTARFFVNPAIFEWYRDPFTNISSRTTFSVGAGYQIVDTKRTEWDVSGGPGYQETHFVSVQPGEAEEASTGAMTIETNFDQDWTKDVEFIYSYRAQFTNSAAGQYNHHMVMTFETEWTSVLDFDFSVIWDRTEKPQEDADGDTPQQDDLRMVVALGIEF